ncbi:MAG: hypothetical protein AB7L66_13380 [Gemmatimonadales bacterium]
MRTFLAVAVLGAAGCGHSAPAPVVPKYAAMAVVLEQGSAAVNDSLVRAAAGVEARGIVPASALASLSEPRRWQQLAVSAPEVGAILSIAPAIEPDRGSAWNEGASGAVETRRSWRRFTARLIDREDGRVVWSETFSNGAPINGFLASADPAQATRLVFAELRAARLLPEEATRF